MIAACVLAVVVVGSLAGKDSSSSSYMLFILHFRIYILEFGGFLEIIYGGMGDYSNIMRTTLSLKF